MANLPWAFYRHALEPGCANGALTEQRAVRCGELTAFDFVGESVRRAPHRLDAFEHVQVLEARFPEFWPVERSDLVVVSEIAYHLTSGGQQYVLRRLKR